MRPKPLVHSLRVGSALAAALFALDTPITAATEPSSYTLMIRNQQFSPDILTIPSGKQVKILIHNQDAMPAEFESYDFNSEKVIPGHSRIPVYIGPLKAGRYDFFNDFYSASKGKLIVK